MAKYTIGLDFGTLSCRGVIADVKDGRILADCSYQYPHGVMTEQLSDGTRLEPLMALQDPADYLEAMDAVIPQLIVSSGVVKTDIIGIGVDATSSTFFPIRSDGTPLCFLPEFSNNPHAWVKLWKHHSPQKETEDIQKLLDENAPECLSFYGGRVSCEWQLPKVLETLRWAPEVYRAADYFIELNDWIVYILSGELCMSYANACFKGMYRKDDGFLENDLLVKLHPELSNYVTEKLNYPICSMMSPGRKIAAQSARRFGLPETCVVANSLLDAHASLPAAGICESGIILCNLGTSACHPILTDQFYQLPGIIGIVEDGLYPGLYICDSGQSAFGDIFDWFSSGYLPEEYAKEAQEKGMCSQQLLTEKAAKLKPDQSKLLALDWWNGNRSVLMNGALRGMMIGFDLETKPEEIYRALIEGAIFGTRKILENYREHGIPVREIRATGGIANKNPLVMQIFADILQMPIQTAGLQYGAALGSAIYAATVAGSSLGGYDDIREAVGAMQDISGQVYIPNPESSVVYQSLYEKYKRLHDYFGIEHPEFMI